jgi:transposase
MKNISKKDRIKYRKRAVKMVELRALNWSPREIAEALNLSRAMVRKTLAKVDNPGPGSLYEGLK